MNEIVADKLDELSATCRRLNVRRLDLFGSATGHGRREYDPSHSDLDFVAWFHEPPQMGPFDQFFGLLEALESLFDRKIDLVDGAAIRNAYFRESIAQTRETIYVARRKKAVG